MAACSKSSTGGETLDDASGIAGGHAYSIISVAEVTDRDGNLVQLVKLRNPWGNFEWKGAWSDNSESWTQELRDQLNHHVIEGQDSNDGTFWMPYANLTEHFSHVYICKYRDNFNYQGERLTQ